MIIIKVVRKNFVTIMSIDYSMIFVVDCYLSVLPAVG